MQFPVWDRAPHCGNAGSSYPAFGAPEQNVHAWGVAIAAGFTLFHQPAGFVQHLVCGEGLRHQQDAVGREGEGCHQSIDLRHITGLVNNEFEVRLAGIAQEPQDGELDAALGGHAGIGQLRRHVELMRQGGTLHLREWRKPRRFNLNSKPCLAEW